MYGTYGNLRLKMFSETGAKHKEMIFNDILHMSFLAGTHVFKAFPAYSTTEL